MRVIVFGASGPSGLELIARARAAGHRVGGFARRPRPSNVPADVEWVTGDAMEAGVVADAVRSQDGVLCALGPAPGAFTRVCSTGTTHILEAMAAAGARRLVCVTGAMAGPSENLGFTYRLIRWMVSRSHPDLLPDRRAQEAAIEKSALDWVILRPPRLTSEPARGSYQVGEALRMGLWARIGRADLAQFAVDQLTANAHLRRAVYIRF